MSLHNAELVQHNGVPKKFYFSCEPVSLPQFQQYACCVECRQNIHNVLEMFVIVLQINNDIVQIFKTGFSCKFVEYYVQGPLDRCTCVHKPGVHSHKPVHLRMASEGGLVLVLFLHWHLIVPSISINC